MCDRILHVAQPDLQAGEGDGGEEGELFGVLDVEAIDVAARAQRELLLAVAAHGEKQREPAGGGEVVERELAHGVVVGRGGLGRGILGLAERELERELEGSNALRRFNTL